MEEELKEAIDKLTDQIAKLGRDIGNKGSSTGGNRTKSANKASGASDDVAKKLNSLGATAKGTSKSLGDMTGANAKLITSSTKFGSTNGQSPVIRTIASALCNNPAL